MAFGKKKKVQAKAPAPAKKKQIGITLPEGYPLPKIFIDEDKITAIRFCLTGFNRHGRIGPEEDKLLRSVFGRSIARFEAEELLECIKKQVD